ncbi:hypothetical protein NQZ68_001824 [Dissostichus eleginoides]|nr:hypothetical protein NQZ68_001824 [Dissostichus eleginoides]
MAKTRHSRPPPGPPGYFTNNLFLISHCAPLPVIKEPINGAGKERVRKEGGRRGDEGEKKRALVTMNFMWKNVAGISQQSNSSLGFINSKVVQHEI